MYFFDTYAIIEIIKGNKNYKKFENYNILTSVLNIGELYYILLKEHGKKIAGQWIRTFNFDLIDIKPEIVIEAAQFRFVNRAKNLSYIDCIGYILAKEKSLKFLTGDKEFKNLPDVEYIK